MDATSCDTVVIIGASSTAFIISSSDVVDDAGGGPGPGAEVSYVAACGELEEIEAVDTAQFKAGEVVEGPLHAVVDLADDKGALAEDAVAAMGLDLTCADRRVSSWRRPTMTGDDESTKWRRQHGLCGQRVKAA
jgi:hypothetical protein